MKKTILFLFIGFVVGCVFMVMYRAIILSPSPDRVPQLGGQEIPGQHYIIDFSKQYDVFCSDWGDEGRRYEKVKILGYTGEAVKEESGSVSKSYGHFSRWLVLEPLDKKKVYIPMSSIKSLKEADGV